MAVTQLPQAVHDLWIGQRPGLEVNPGQRLSTGLGSDLAVGDYLIGMRATVTAVGTTTSGVRQVTIRRRADTALTQTIGIVAASTLWFGR